MLAHLLASTALGASDGASRPGRNYIALTDYESPANIAEFIGPG